MVKLVVRWFLACGILAGATGLACGQTATLSSQSSPWVSEALAAGWQPPAEWPGQSSKVELIGFQAQEASYSSGSCQVDCASCCDACCGVGSWLDNTQVWFGGEGFKSIGDTTLPPGFVTGYQESFGLVAGFNSGFGIGNSSVRAQVGASYGGYDLKGRDFFETASVEQQVYLTAGLYKRSDICSCDPISWGVVYDQFLGHQWGVYAEEISLSQVRGIFGYALSECNEVGVWGTFHLDDELSASGLTNLRAMNQANVYLRHNFAFGGTGMLYTGVFDPADTSSWQVGFLGDAPLNDAVSLYANCNVVLPGSATGVVGSNELLWNFGVGVMVSLGAKSQAPTVSGHAGMPLLPVANNGSFLIGY